MSDHDLSLRGLSTEYARQVKYLEGEPYNYHLEGRVQRMLDRYKLAMKQRWGVEIVTTVKWHAQKRVGWRFQQIQRGRSMKRCWPN